MRGRGEGAREGGEGRGGEGREGREGDGDYLATATARSTREGARPRQGRRGGGRTDGAGAATDRDGVGRPHGEGRPAARGGARRRRGERRRGEGFDLGEGNERARVGFDSESTRASGFRFWRCRYTYEWRTGPRVRHSYTNMSGVPVNSYATDVSLCFKFLIVLNFFASLIMI